MPLPKPKAEETQKDFIARCMSDKIMIAEYQRQDQRLAVCYISWRDRNKVKK